METGVHSNGEHRKGEGSEPPPSSEIPNKKTPDSTPFPQNQTPVHQMSPEHFAALLIGKLHYRRSVSTNQASADFTDVLNNMVVIIGREYWDRMLHMTGACAAPNVSKPVVEFRSRLQKEGLLK